MNENIEKLEELKADLEAIEQAHGDILAKEPVIARPLHAAADEARRRYKHVTEGHGPPIEQ